MEKNRGYFQRCAPLLHLLEACDPKDPVCPHLHGDQPPGNCAFLVGNQVFELRHDSIGGKVTTGRERLRKAPTTTAPKFGRSLSNDRERLALSLRRRSVSSCRIRWMSQRRRQRSSTKSNQA